MSLHGKLKKHKEGRRRLINLRVQKMINIRFSRSHVSIVNLNWKEVDYASSVISRCWKRGWFFLGWEFFPSRQRVLPFSGKNAKFARRATTFWLEYAAEEKENRKRTAKVWGNVGVNSVKRATVSFSLSPRRRKYFTFRYHLTRGSKEPKAIAGNWWEKWSKKESTVSRRTESLWFASSAQALRG